nr:solute carrier family 35 (UDP-xylose/UDP-N-acetylglucosamine transporter), member B4 [Cryptococcus depauperatus CBS 7855]
MLDSSLLASFLQTTAGDWFMVLPLVFGGCCSNVWLLEGVLKDYPQSGTFLTFAQFTYVAVQNLSSQLEIVSSKSRVPYLRLKPRKVPLKRWIVQVILFFAVSLMNNYAFGLKIPVTIHIIFRSGGLGVSMIVGRIVGKRRYSFGQMLAGLLITVGIVLATLSAPHRRPSSTHTDVHANTAEELTLNTPRSWLGQESEYLAGAGVLFVALVLSALLGLYQEQTFKLYGRQWKEALFYGHFLSLPLFAPFYSDLVQTYNAYGSSPSLTLLTIPCPSISSSMPLFAESSEFSSSSWQSLIDWHDILLPSAMFSLVLSLVTQGICVRGVNKLTTMVNSVTVNLILTVRKAVSLVISVWYYGNSATPGLVIGGGMVLLGTILYSLAPGPKGIQATQTAQPATIQEEKVKVQVVSRPVAVQAISVSDRDSSGFEASSAGISKEAGTNPLAIAGLRYRQIPIDSTIGENSGK